MEKKIGNGKEYKGDKLTYEGEYSIGEKHGKGKEYYDNGNIKFEGEYKYGLRWNGNMNDYKNKFLFEIKNGKGKGKEYKGDKIIFEGEFIK